MSTVDRHPTTTALEDEKDLSTTHEKDIVVAEENPEYIEFLALSDLYQGDALNKLTKKIDWHVLPQLVFIYLLSYIDRGNVGNAKLFGAMQDMKMDSKMWNLGLSLFFITYAFAGPPCSILLKKLGPKLVLSGVLLGVSLILICSGCSGSIASWFPLRLLLGLFEAGMYPGCAWVLTTWYTPDQIHSRHTIFYCGACLAGAFSGLLAYGIGQLDYTWGYRGWRFIYIIEGVFSTCVAVGAYFVLQETPAKQGGWLDDQERRFLVLRNKFAYGKDKGGSADTLNKKDVLAALTSIHVWILSFGYFCVGCWVYGLSFTIPTIMNNMGFTAADSQALSAPPYVFATFCVVASGWFSDKYKTRALATVLPALMGFIGLLICVLSVTHKHLVALTYVGVCLAQGGSVCLSPAFSVWTSLNAAGSGKRAVAISVAVVWVQLGGLVGSNIYLANESPAYHTGFGVSLAFLGLGNIVTPILYWFLIGHINGKRDKMSEEEIYEKYTAEELQEMGDLSPLYRYER
ncbi:hypothetical protein L198_08058 [Cryptococcus wingfieldii CBS 7118]|uniref:Major facilitator superfamily (MFS) profile domain-containing protein n=1 Tax=Cryptococcus wingfieldii CBS 7118 TaxID=1295528 RepID=A0A1E3HJF1_9TREE|nr:hypothetical protein L198_08058 [Cryptococcus wingfieldii CBS 7118]ODN76463.1 hypothetical protein L198_08058 [Cryptococcus wingfieldii CBS 7118]